MGSGNTMDHKIIFLLLAVLLLLSVQQTSGGPIKTSEIVNKNYCRNHIFSPRCRGQQKRDIMSRSEDYRLAPLEEFPGNDRSRELAAILNSQTPLGDLLRKLIENTPEYDTETTNYVR